MKIEELLTERATPEPNTGCWIWLGATVREHGSMRINMKHIYAHRLAYELVHGPISEGKLVCHKCHNPYCINPDHLYVGTHSDNVRDSIKNGTHRNQNSKKEFCKRGHRLVKENIFNRTDGRRACKICHSIVSAEKRKKIREGDNDRHEYKEAAE